MHPRTQAFVERTRNEYGFEPPIEEFPEGTKTAEDAAEAIGCSVAQIASSLAFEVDDRLVVAVTSGANRVDESALAAHFDVDKSSVSMADPDRIKSTLGWSIGGVPPFCHDRDVPVVIDETLLEFETVWAAAGTPKAVFAIDPSTLRSYAGGDVIQLAE